MTTLIVPRIPSETTLRDIREFIAPALTRWWPFSTQKDVDKLQIKIFHDTGTGFIEYHALIYTREEALGKKIIRKMNRKPLLGKPVAVREYFIRQWQNDRRASAGLKTTEPAGSLRKVERRRGTRLQEITNASALFVQVDMARKLL